MAVKVSYELSKSIKSVVSANMEEEIAQVIIQYITDLEKENVALKGKIGRFNIQKHKTVANEKENDNDL